MTIAEQFKFEGREEGRVEGMKKEAYQATETIARKLLADNLSIVKVQELTDLPIEVLQRLQEAVIH